MDDDAILILLRGNLESSVLVALSQREREAPDQIRETIGEKLAEEKGEKSENSKKKRKEKNRSTSRCCRCWTRDSI
jgi:hypothetical protein